MGLEATSVGAYVGGYKLLRYLGEGRLGLAFRARNQDEEQAHAHGGDVALRALRVELCQRPGFRERFSGRLRAIGQLDHPGIVRHIDALELPDGQLCLVEELVEGSTMAELVGRGLPMPWSRAMTFVHPVLAALAHARAREVVHGAVCPKNVVVRSGDEAVLLADFGIPGEELGPGLEYLAPERLREGAAALLAVRPVGEPTEVADVYSVGMILFVALTGTYPWGSSREPREIMEAKRGGHFQRVDALNPAVPPPLASVVAAALAADPTQRLATVTEMARALTQATEPALGTWVKPGRTITREKQFVAQRLEEALARRESLERQGSLPKLKAVDLRAPSSRTLAAIHLGEVDPQEVARIEKAREAWASRERRASARAWAFAAAGGLGPMIVVLGALLLMLGVRVPIPADWAIFVLPSIPFFYAGGMLALLAGLRRLGRPDLALVVPGLLSPIIATGVLFGADALLSWTKLGGAADSSPRAGILLALVWCLSGLLGAWAGERLNVRAERAAVERRLPAVAQKRPLTGRHRAVP